MKGHSIKDITTLLGIPEDKIYQADLTKEPYLSIIKDANIELTEYLTEMLAQRLMEKLNTPDGVMQGSIHPFISNEQSVKDFLHSQGLIK
jgi:hypothetical protein